MNKKVCVSMDCERLNNCPYSLELKQFCPEYGSETLFPKIAKEETINLAWEFRWNELKAIIKNENKAVPRKGLKRVLFLMDDLEKRATRN